MKTKKHWVHGLIVLFYVFLFTGCGFLNNLLSPSVLPAEDSAPQPTGYSISRYIDDASIIIANKENSGLSSDQITTLKQYARTEVGATHLHSDNIELYAEFAVEGALKSLGSMTFSDDDEKILAFNTVLASFIAALNGHLQAVEERAGSARNILARSNAISGLLSRIAGAAVRTIQLAGVSSDKIPEATGSAVETIVSSLGSGGVRQDYISPTVGAIAQRAVESLTQSGLSGEEAIATAVNRISSGAVRAATSTGVQGVTNNDVPQLVQAISQGATQAAVRLSAESTTSVNAQRLAGAASSGAVTGIQQAVERGSVQNDQVIVLVRSTSEGASSGAALASEGNKETATGLLNEVTRQISSTATRISNQDTTALVVAVAQSSAAGAQSFGEDGMDSEDLKGAIRLVIASSSGSDDDDEEVVIDEAIVESIESGVTLGRNTPPVAVAGPNLTIELGDTVELDGSDSSDVETPFENLQFNWLVSVKPSAALDWSASGAEVVFTPDVPGIYHIVLRVTDEGGRFSDDLLVLTVKPSPATVEFEGKTAGDRLTIAKDLFEKELFYDARAELNTILTRYQVVPEVFPEALFILGATLQTLGFNDLSLNRLNQLITDFPDSTHWVIRARTELAVRDIWQADTRFAATAKLQAIIDEFSEEDATAFARIGFAHVDRLEGRYQDARTAYFDLLNNNNDPEVLHWLPNSIGQTYSAAGDLQAAEDYYLSVINGDVGYFDKLSKATIRVVHHNLISVYQQMGDAGKEPLKALLITVRENDDLIDAHKLHIMEHGYAYLFRRFQEFDLAEHELTLALEEYAHALVDDARGWVGAGWAHVTLMDLYRERIQRSSDQTEIDSYVAKTLTSYNKVTTKYSWVNRFQISANARRALVDLYLWALRNNTKAEQYAREFVAVSYPPNAMPGVRSLAANRLGHVLLRNGWDARNQAGVDHRNYFNEALHWLERATPLYDPGVSENQWFITESRRMRIEVLVGLDRYSEAKSAAMNLLQQTSNDSEKAEISRLYVWAIAEQVRTLSWNSRFQEAGLVALEFESLLNQLKAYTNSDGSLVNNGWAYARSIIDMARAAERYTSEIRWHDLDFDQNELVGVIEYALGYLGQVVNQDSTPNTQMFNIDPRDWVFQEANTLWFRLLNIWGSVDDSKYDDAIARAETLIQNYDYFDQNRIVWVYGDLARIYRDRAQLVRLHSLDEIEIPLAFENMKTDYLSAHSHMLSAANKANELGISEHGLHFQLDAYYIYARLLDTVREYFNRLESFPVSPEEVIEWYSTAQNGLTSLTQNSSLSSVDDGGRLLQRAQKHLGELNRTAGQISYSIGEQGEAREYFELAMNSLRQAANQSNYPGAHFHEISYTRRTLVYVLLDTSRTYRFHGQEQLAENQAKVTAYFGEAYDWWALLMADVQLQDRDVVWTSLEMGRAVWELWDLLTGVLSEGEDLGNPEQKAEVGSLFLDLVIAEFSFFEGGEAANRARLYKAWILHQLGREYSDKHEVEDAEASWNQAIELLEQIPQGDSWVQNEAQRWIDIIADYINPI